MLVDPGQKAYTQSMPAKAQLKLVRSAIKTPDFFMVKFTTILLSALTTMFVSLFIFSLVVPENKLPLE